MSSCGLHAPNGPRMRRRVLAEYSSWALHNIAACIIDGPGHYIAQPFPADQALPFPVDTPGPHKSGRTVELADIARAEMQLILHIVCALTLLSISLSVGEGEFVHGLAS